MENQSPQKKEGAQQPLTFRPMYCGQTAGWTDMPVGTEVGIGRGHIVLDGDPAPNGARSEFSAHV